METDGEPVDLTGKAARMNVRPSATSSSLVLDASPYFTLGGQEGTILLEVPASVMESVPGKTFVYDIELVTPNEYEDEVVTILEGSFVVDPEVTRPDDQEEIEEPEE
jgi:hypothetical protein